MAARAAVAPPIREAVAFGRARVRARRRRMADPKPNAGLMDYITTMHPWYEPNWHHYLLASRLEAVERGDIKRLMVFMPPRSGKTEIVSKNFPAWFLGRNPDRHVLAASYSDVLANENAMAVRDAFLRDDNPFRLSLRSDSRRKQLWHLAGHRGMYLAAGVRGAMTGFGGNLAVIDDPVKDRIEADSAVYREAVWQWYSSTLRTRLAPGGAIVLLMTRWNQDDLGGRLLRAMEEGGEQWEVLTLPAIAEHDEDWGEFGSRKQGDALWPERFPLSEIEAQIQAMTPRDVASLLQQRPTPAEGAVFQRDWFSNRIDLHDETLARRCAGRYISWDTAMKDRDESDWTAATVFELAPDYSGYIREVYRAKLKFPELPDAIERMAHRYNRDGKLKGVIIEDKGSGTSAIQTLRATAETWLSDILIPFLPVGDKVYRAEQAATWCRNGMVSLPLPNDAAPWLLDFEQELFDFPGAPHDDRVDTFSQVVLYLEHLLEAGLTARRQVDAQHREGEAA